MNKAWLAEVLDWVSEAIAKCGGPGGTPGPCPVGNRPNNPDSGKYPHLAHMLNGRQVHSVGHSRQTATDEARKLIAQGVHASLLQDPKQPKGSAVYGSCSTEKRLMSLLDNLPHRCTIFHRVSQPDGLGGVRYGVAIDAQDVPCWEQQASASEKMAYEKRGIDVSTKVYFTSNPNVTERHLLLITKRFGVAQANLDITDVANPDVFDVKSAAYPDASAGMGILWRVMCGSNTGATE